MSATDTQPVNLARLWIRRLAAPLLATVVYFLLPDVAQSDTTLSAEARATAAAAVLMAGLWATEAIPLAATALLPLVLFPMAGLMPIRQAAAPYAHEYIFLFMGGFMLALAMERWGLHRRIALLCLLAVGSRPDRLVGGFMLSTACLSMWISNTACTVMMLPIALGVIGRLQVPADKAALSSDAAPDAPKLTNAFAVCLLLGIAYGASIGGVGTLIGTPPNVFLAGFLETTYDIKLGFGRWMMVGVPLVAVFLPIAWLLLTRVVFPISQREIPAGRDLIRNDYRALGPLRPGEKRVLVVFLCTVIAWIVREPLCSWDAALQVVPALAALTDAGIAISAALLLFFLPVDMRKRAVVLDWKTAERLPWGVLLLFGGGLSLAAAFRISGLANWISQFSDHTQELPLVLLLLLVVTGIVFLTELTSNTATAATFLPVLAGVAQGIQLDPVMLVVPAALAASCAFMMPVATPPNAIVFGSGHLRIQHMLRAGLWLNLVAIALIMTVTFTIVVHVISTQ